MRPLILSALLFAGSPAFAENVIEAWGDVKPPATAPELKSVGVDPKTTALLLLDFNGAEAAASGPCNATNKPRCVATLPAVRALLDRARAKGMMVVYSVTPNASRENIRAPVAPEAAEAVVKAAADKFVGTPLADLLNGKGIKTVIVTGTGSEGAVLDTATAAELEQGMTAIVPVDAMSSSELYAEQYVAWHLTHAPGVSAKTVLTRTDLIGF